MLISSIILSGGRATRMGSSDKGLIPLQNKPLIQHIINRLKPQVDEIIINANREIAKYEAFGFRVLQDELENFAGPLAGISLGLKYAASDLVLSVPCDSPLLPCNLAERLLNGMLESRADIAVAGRNGNAHPVICLCKKNVLPSLQSFLEAGEHKVSAWQKSQKYVEVDFTDCMDAFVNLNTFEDLDILEKQLSHG